MTRHLSGWKRQLPDHRDKKLTGARAKLPAAADLRSAKLPRVEDQGQLGSCTANASTSAVEHLALKQGKPLVELSRLFLYYSTRVWTEHGDPSDDSGCVIRDVMKALKKRGVCSERSWPYDVSRFAVEPQKAAVIEAELDRVTSYLSCRSLRSIKASIVSGYPVVGGFSVPASMLDAETERTGIVSFPAPHEEMVGGHCVLFVGYDDARQLLIFENSWGTSWGDAGFGYLPYRFFTAGLADDFWTVRGATK